jgi:glutamate-ammonia-ligase adenylyltransferase
MDIHRALAFSRYATRALAADPGLAESLTESSPRTFAWDNVRTSFATLVAEGDAASHGIALRALRRRVFLHTLVRDLTGLAPLTEVCGAMTQLAELALDSSVELHTRLLAANHGVPLGADDAAPQRLIVIGMGKLGGGELNVASDIDLIFVYPDEGETAGPRTIANREFFDRLGQRVIGALHDVTPQGYVFRVDMRLRPYGESGPLTTTFNGLEAYLVTQGRAWERYAWLKARALTGNRRAELDALVAPFVFRKYLDYDAYDGLRDVHRQIREQGLRRDYLANVKLGDGGIREIEFIVQALQIVRGGREPQLRVKGTLPALVVLESLGLLPGPAVAALRDAYVFLRRVEHRLQYRDDQQTHQLPESADERALLAESMGAVDLREFDAALARHRAQVSEQFALILGKREENGTAEIRRSARSGRSPRRRRRRASSWWPPASPIPTRCWPCSRACAAAAATCNCPRCRDSASMPSSRS